MATIADMDDRLDVTNFGPEPGFGSVSNIATAKFGAVIGALQTLLAFVVDDLGAALTDSVVGRYKAPFKYRIVKVISDNQSVTNAADFDLYNGTDAAAVTGNVSLTTAAATETTTFSAAGRNVIDENDELQLRATTIAGGAIEGLKVWLVVQSLENTADNV